VTPYFSEDGITIYNADCRSVLAELEPESIGCVVTSPPYNFGTFTRDGRKKQYDSHDDDMPPRVYRSWIGAVMFDLYRVTAAGASVFWNHKGKYRDNRYESPYWITEISPFDFRQDIIWRYPASPDVAKNKFYPRLEYVFWLSKGSPQCFDERSAAQGNVWEINHCSDVSLDHPAPFPEPLAKRCITATPEGIVLDPFLGSGTTLRAAKDAGRQAIGIEISERYCEMAANRLRQGVLFGV
jgi:site-specific DNA-methyltransferase (adenine-specific)